MEGISPSELERIISAMKARKRSRTHLLTRSELSGLSAISRESQNSLDQLLAKGGLEVDKIKAVLTKRDADKRRLLESRKARAAKTFSRDKLRSGIDGRIKAFELSSRLSQPYASTNIVLDTPFLIYADPYYILRSSSIERLGSLARIHVRHTGEFSDLDTVSFYFLWQNSSDNYALLNVETYVVANGWFQITADSGIFGGAWANIFGAAELDLLEWWNHPPTSPLQMNCQSAVFADITAWAGSSLWSPGDDSFETFLRLSLQFLPTVRQSFRSVWTFTALAHLITAWPSPILQTNNLISLFCARMC